MEKRGRDRDDDDDDDGRKEGTEVERKWIHQCTRGDRGEHDTGSRDTKLS